MSNLKFDLLNQEPLAECGARWKALLAACQAHALELAASEKEMYAMRQSELSRHQMELNRIEAERESRLAQCEYIFKQAQDQTLATAAMESRDNDDQSRVSIEEINNKFEENLQDNKQHLEEAVWLADSVLETGESAPRIEFEDTRANYANSKYAQSIHRRCFGAIEALSPGTSCGASH